MAGLAVRVQPPPVEPPDQLISAAIAVFFLERQIAPVAAFNKAALDGVRLTFLEFRSLLESEGCQLTEAHARRAFSAADVDGDGALSRHEWVKLLTPPERGEAPAALGSKGSSVHRGTRHVGIGGSISSGAPGVWRRCRVLPGWCAAVGPYTTSVHADCGGEDVQLTSLSLPALAKDMTHGVVARWLVGPGVYVPKGGAIAEVQPVGPEPHIRALLALEPLNRIPGHMSPETFPLRLQKWASEYDKRTLPPPLVLRAPRALVLASQSYVDTPTPELPVGASVALVVYLDTGVGDDASCSYPSNGKAQDAQGQKEDEVSRAARVTAALDSEKARMKRGWFSEAARSAVQMRRLAQKEFMTVEDNDKFLPTCASGLALHMGDVNTPHPVMFMGGGGSSSGGSTMNRRGMNNSRNSSATTTMSCSSTAEGAVDAKDKAAPLKGPSRDGRSLSAFVAALEEARSQVQGSRAQVSDARMVALFTSALLQDQDSTDARRIGRAVEAASHAAAAKAAQQARRRRAALAASGLEQADAGLATLRSSTVSNSRFSHTRPWDLPRAGVNSRSTSSSSKSTSSAGNGVSEGISSGESQDHHEDALPSRECVGLTFDAAVALALAHPAAASLQQSKAEVAAAAAHAAATQPEVAPPSPAADAARASFKLLGIEQIENETPQLPMPLAGTPPAWR